MFPTFYTIWIFGMPILDNRKYYTYRTLFYIPLLVITIAKHQSGDPDEC